jgi:hypothetical protein
MHHDPVRLQFRCSGDAGTARRIAMTRESDDLITARRCLDEGEAAFPSDEALYALDEGLGLLAGIIAERDGRERTVARNAGLSCVNRLAGRIEQTLAARDVPEPDLKRLMRGAQVLAGSAFAADANADLAALTVAAAGRYLDALFEGYPPEEKAREIERLTQRLLASDA